MRINKYLIEQVFYNFCRRTTIHGINHLSQVKNKRGCIFWFSVVGIATLGFTINLFQIVERYLQYQVLSNTYHDHEIFEFPEMSVCNLNPVFVPPSDTKDYQNLLSWISEYSKIKKDKYHASSYLNSLSDFLYIQRKDFSHPGWSFITHCKYQTRVCSWNNFMPISLWPYGNCFIFNPLSMNMSRVAIKDPTYRGYRPNFEVILYKGIDFPEEMKQDPHEIITMPSGILLMIHEPQSYPYIFEGYLLDFFSVVDLKITRKFHESNLKQCIKVRNNYTYVDQVTNTTKNFIGRWADCIYHIIQNEVHKSCNCVMEQYPISVEFQNSEFCKSSIAQKTAGSLNMCLKNAFGEILKHEKNMNLCYKDLCDHSSYETIISQAKYPAVEERNSEMVWLRKLAEIEKIELETFGKSDLASKSLIKNTNLSLKQAFNGRRKDLLDKNFVNRNFMLLRVVAQSLFMDRVEEVQEYPISRLLSDIGGCVGLWLGASLITIFELFDLIFDSAELLCSNTYYRYKKIDFSLNETKKFSNNIQSQNFNLATSNKVKENISKSQLNSAEEYEKQYSNKNYQLYVSTKKRCGKTVYVHKNYNIVSSV